jgi:putative hemolysin
MHKGILSESESRIIQDILEAGNIPVKQILTHRSQLLYISINETISKAISLMCEGEQTVCCAKKKSSDNEVAGFVYLSDALRRKNNISIKNIMVPAVQFIESNETANLIRVMFREGYKDVCIYDEFGAFSGTISLNKCIKYILNLTTVRPVPDEQGTVSHKFDGMTELQTIKDWIPPSLSQQAKSSRTINGLLSSYLGRIPKKGEVFAIDGWSFYIIEARLNRIESVLIKKEV